MVSKCYHKFAMNMKVFRIKNLLLKLYVDYSILQLSVRERKLKDL